jgi:hypothetical protein
LENFNHFFPIIGNRFADKGNSGDPATGALTAETTRRPHAHPAGLAKGIVNG